MINSNVNKASNGVKVDVGGVLIDNLSKQEVLDEIGKSVHMDKNVYIVTPYSEMIVFAMNDPKYKEALNHAQLSLPDGIGILWAAKYLNSNASLLTTLFAILFNRTYTHSVIKEQITGSRLIYDLAKLSAEKNFSLALVGGQGNVAAQAAYELKKLYPNLNIKLALSGRPFDGQIIKEINDSSSDILLLAYSPPKQETWLFENSQNLTCKVAIGLGGTFDYLAEIRPPAPNFMHYIGLEWFWRLITQPWRIIRIWNAVPVFIWKIYKYKLNHHG